MGRSAPSTQASRVNCPLRVRRNVVRRAASELRPEVMRQAADIGALTAAHTDVEIGIMVVDDLKSDMDFDSFPFDRFSFAGAIEFLSIYFLGGKHGRDLVDFALK